MKIDSKLVKQSYTKLFCFNYSSSVFLSTNTQNAKCHLPTFAYVTALITCSKQNRIKNNIHNLPYTGLKPSA